MRATLELNVDAFNQAIRQRNWSDVAAARELGVARSTIYRLRNKEMGMSGEFIAAVLIKLSRPKQAPGKAFQDLFVVVIPTKE